MANVVGVNWVLGMNYYVPLKGEHIWYWEDYDTAMSYVVKDVRMVNGLPEVFLGRYISTVEGREYIKENEIYLNECMGNEWDCLIEKFSVLDIERYFNKIWISCSDISYPNRRNEMFIQKCSHEQLLKKLNEVMNGVTD